MPTLAEEVEDRIGDVNDTLNAAIYDLEDGIFHPPGTAATVERLKLMRGPIDAWAARGRKALPSSTPGVTGWPGWISAGDYFLQGIAAQRGMPAAETLANIEATAIGVKDTTVDYADKAGKVAERAVHRTAAAVGDAAGTVAKPLTMPLAFVAVGLVAAAVIFLKVRP